MQSTSIRSDVYTVVYERLHVHKYVDTLWRVCCDIRSHDMYDGVVYNVVYHVDVCGMWGYVYIQSMRVYVLYTHSLMYMLYLSISLPRVCYVMYRVVYTPFGSYYILPLWGCIISYSGVTLSLRVCKHLPQKSFSLTALPWSQILDLDSGDNWSSWSEGVSDSQCNSWLESPHHPPSPAHRDELKPQ